MPTWIIETDAHATRIEAATVTVDAVAGILIAKSEGGQTVFVANARKLVFAKLLPEGAA